MRDLFAGLDESPSLADVEVSVSFFEIYGPKCQDLLAGRRRLAVSHRLALLPDSASSSSASVALVQTLAYNCAPLPSNANKVREDGKGEVHVAGLEEVDVTVGRGWRWLSAYLRLPRIRVPT